MIQVEVLRISYFPPSKGYVVVLKEIEGDRQIPIIVGSTEAQAIAMALEGIEMPRPLTHHLILSILDNLDVKIDRIEITDIRNGTFFAKIILRKTLGGEAVIDSRPSDAIAVGLRSMAEIVVDESVMNSVSLIEESVINEETEDSPKSYIPIKSSEDILENLNEALVQAVEDEEYEIAAKIRDQIKQLEKRSSN